MNIVNGDLIPAVNEILDLLGDPTLFTRTVLGSYDPTTGTNSGNSVTTFTCNGISDQFNAVEMQDQSIVFGDMKYIVKPKDGNVPKVGDVATVTGIDYKVLAVRNDNIQGSTYLFTLHLRS